MICWQYLISWFQCLEFKHWNFKYNLSPHHLKVGRLWSSLLEKRWKPWQAAGAIHYFSNQQEFNDNKYKIFTVGMRSWLQSSSEFCDRPAFLYLDIARNFMSAPHHGLKIANRLHFISAWYNTETVNYQAKSTNQGRAARIVISPFLHWEVNIEPPTSGRVFVWAGAGQHLEIPLTCLDLIEVHSMAQLRAIGSIKDICPPCLQLHFFISDIFLWEELVKGNLAMHKENWKESVEEETTEERKQMGGR